MSQKKSQLEPTGAARPRTASAQFLNNKEFAYLLDENKEDTLASPTSPTTTITITPALLNGNNKNNNSNNKSNKKDRFSKPRTSSIQVETTKTQNEQLNAIKKEVEFLRSEVPHFDKIYNNSQQQWIVSKRNKADTEAFALIQSLTEWIHKFGNKAVKEYDEFKESAEKEIISMVSKMEGLTHENTKLNLLIEEAETEKEELNNKYQIAERDIIKYKKTEQELKTKQQTNELNNNTVTDLENELLLIKQKNKTLTEKYERVEKYWKMTQDENDELRNRNYSMDDEINQLKSQLKSNNENLQAMDIKHQKTLKNLELEHQNYAQQMQNEQEKLIQAQHQANNSAEQMQSLNTAYNIDADDEDIGGSGITDDNDEYTQGGIVSLGDEINVYEYEDDEWLDETDSDYDDDEEAPQILEPEPEPEESEEEEEEEEEYNKQIEFVTVKESYHLDIKYSDISKGFKSIKQWTMNEDKTNNFEMAKQTLSKENKLRAINEKKEEEKEIYNQFESEKIKIEVEAKPNNKSLGLSMSKTAVSHTPQMSGPMDDFQSIKMKSEVIDNNNRNKNMEFSSAKTGIMAKENELKQPQKPIIYNKIVHVEKGKDNKMIMGGRNFAERLAMFKHMADTKGGKPEILQESKAYALVNKWKDKNKNNTASGISSVINSIGNEEQMDINKNIHVTKSTVHSVGDSHKRGQTVNVLKITKTKSHKLKPRLFGYMNIIRSSFIPKWKLTTQKPRYFFVLDGLPSETNINSREPDFAKNRQHDFLVPTLFFFKDKDDYDIFYKQVCDLPTRQIKFQKLFAKYAKGIFPLNQYAMEINVSNCMKRVNKLKNKQNENRIKLPINEINECGDVNELTILLCNDKQIHKFQCTDKFSRIKWIKKVNKLVDKRANRLININNGLLGVQNNNQKLSRKSVTEDIDEQNNNNYIDDGMNTPMGRASIIGNVKSRGYSNIKDVEPGFD